MKDLWNVLEIEGDMGKAQILFAQIEHYTLGGLEDDGIMKIFVSLNVQQQNFSELSKCKHKILANF